MPYIIRNNTLNQKKVEPFDIESVGKSTKLSVEMSRSTLDPMIRFFR